jgi:hypothetical protein
LIAAALLRRERADAGLYARTAQRDHGRHRERIVALFLVANNLSYRNDEVHRANVARTRSRNLDNKQVGIAIDHRAPDFVGLGEAQGVGAVAPVAARDMLPEALLTAANAVRDGKPFLVDVRT